jgi:hypothetical protein
MKNITRQNIRSYFFYKRELERGNFEFISWIPSHLIRKHLIVKEYIDNLLKKGVINDNKKSD